MKIEMKFSDVPIFTKFKWRCGDYVKIPKLECLRNVTIGSYKTETKKFTFNAYELDINYVEIGEDETVTIEYNSIDELKKILG